MDFSISQLIDFLNCPQAYQYKRIEKLPWEFVPADMKFGDVIHKTIQVFHTKRQVKKEELVNQFLKRWDEVVKIPDLRYRSFSEEDLRERGKRLIELYYENFSALAPEDIELYFEIPLLDLATGRFDGHFVHGRIDLVADAKVHEIKTSGKSYTQEQADTSLQLTFYCWAYEYLYSRPPEGLKMVVLVKTKEPNIQVISTKRTRQDFTRLHSLMTNVIKAIESGIYYPNPLATYGCKNCPFQLACKGRGNEV